MRSAQEVMVHGSLIKMGYNIPAPSPYIVEKEKELMPKEEVRDMYYEIAPMIAGLSLSDRRSLLRALVLTLLTPIQVIKFEDFIEENIVDFTMWMRKNPGYESKDTEEQRAEAYSKFLASCGKRDYEVKQSAKRMAKKVMGEIADIEGISDISDLFDDEND